MLDRLQQITGLSVYPASISKSPAGPTIFMGRKGVDKFVGFVGCPCPQHGRQVGELDGQCICLAPLDHATAVFVRQQLPWAAPRPLGLATSIGTGDRLGLATPGHIRAVKGTGLLPVLAQQSIREMTRTQRTAEDVVDCATFGVLQEGYTGGFGADADHIQQPEGLDLTAAAGCTLFTIDPGQHVVPKADTMSRDELSAAFAHLDMAALRTSASELAASYAGQTFTLADGSKLSFSDADLLRSAAKYGRAVAHIVRMFEHLRSILTRPFELEVSVDETATPTTPAEHFFVARELSRLGVKWVSLAPRFIGEFEKGVDYIGDLAEFRRQLQRHVAVMRTLGPYKISVHSGSDKFSIYPIVAELAGGLVHLKTAGTSWLEALRAVAQIDAELFREIYAFALERYDTDRQSYHVSASVAKAPPAAAVKDAPALLEDFNAREILHVTFGSVLTAGDSQRFRPRIYAALRQSEEVYYAALQRHIGRHAAPFRKAGNG
jgi:hypothetical protein